MGLNIQNTSSFQFENRESLKNTAKSILTKQGASEENAEEFVEKSIFGNSSFNYTTSQLAAIKAATQINMNTKLKETLKYIKSHAHTEVKKAVLGELWEVFETTESSAVEKQTTDLFEFSIDNTKNIFAA